MDILGERIRELPPELRREVEDFVEFLHEKRWKGHRRKPELQWAGALKDLRGKYSSVELQHTISKWRIGGR